MKPMRLWVLFMASTALILMLGTLAPAILTFALLETGLLTTAQPVAWIPLFGIIFASLLFSLFLLTLLSRYFFRPIQDLIRALKQVASGDFSVRLPEDQGEKIIQDMNLNFNKMVRELNSINTLQSDFIQNVSHEFKTPLAAMEGYATLISEAADLPHELREYARRILDGTGQLSSLTGNILKLSKLENQQIISKKNHFLLDEQLRRIILSMEPVWSCKELEMDLDLPETDYYGNEELMLQFWTNLLSNAVKFTPKQGIISIRLKKNADSVLVEFQDSGIGMTDEVKSHIFERFYQGDPSRSSQGNGLGLALVSKIVTLCGGTISVESEPDSGSRFLIQLPATYDQP